MADKTVNVRPMSGYYADRKLKCNERYQNFTDAVINFAEIDDNY